MDEFSHGARRQSVKKLLTVLRHGLRGIQGDEDNIAASYKDRGLPVPDHITEPPSIRPEFSVYWTAYADLQHDRPPPSFSGTIRRIPWSAIAGYARHHGMNVDELKRYVWRLDSELIESKGVDSDVPESDEDQPETDANG
jgi:hypothetical protein